MELLNIQWLFSRWFSQNNEKNTPIDKITDPVTRTYRFIDTPNVDVINAETYLRNCGRHNEADEMMECYQAFIEYSQRHFE